MLTRPDTTKIFASLQAVLLAILLLFCVWTLDRGFDITDESYLLLLSSRPAAFPVFVSAFHWVASPLWQMTQSLYLFRLLGLVLLLCSSCVLACGIIHVAPQQGLTSPQGRMERWIVLASCLIPALHLESYGVTTFFFPSYNLLAECSIYLTLGISFLVDMDRRRWTLLLLRLLTGFCIAVALLCKFPAGINGLCVTLFILSYRSRNWRDWSGATALILAGIGVTLLAFTLSQMSLDTAYANFQRGLAMYKVALGESAADRLKRNGGELLLHAYTIFELFKLALAGFLLYAWRSTVFTAVIALLAMAYSLVMDEWLLLDLERQHEAIMTLVNAQIVPLVALFLLWLITTFPVWIRQWKAFLFTGTLSALPYCLALGTTNELPPQIIIFLAPWGGIMALVALDAAFSGHRRWMALTTSFCFSFICVVQVINSGFYPSYHMSRPLTEQTVPVTIATVGELKVDEDIHAFVTDVQEAGRRCHIAAGRPILGLYNDPGVALILNAVPVLTPWLIESQMAQVWLKTAPPETLHSAVIALQLLPDGSTPIIPEAVQGFPANYHLCGTAIYPYQQQKIQLWVPNSPF